VIVGIGVDLVDTGRFERALARTPGIRERLFTEQERHLGGLSLAVRFAAKEAIAKALGAPHGLSWHDVTVGRGDRGRPVVETRGTVAARIAELGGERVHLSLSHDAGVAMAFVVIESVEGAVR
jgi:holo-[acyl-carrier protein] synthase